MTLRTSTGVGAQLHTGLLRPDGGGGEVDEVTIALTPSTTAFEFRGRSLGSIDTTALDWRRAGGGWAVTIGDDTWRFTPHDPRRFTQALAECTGTHLVIDLTADDADASADRGRHADASQRSRGGR